MNATAPTLGVLGIVLGFAIGWLVFAGEQASAPVSPPEGPGAPPILEGDPKGKLTQLADQIEEYLAESTSLRDGATAAPDPEVQALRSRAIAWLRTVGPARFGWLTADRVEHLYALDLSRLNLDREDLALLAAFPNLAELNLRGLGVRDEDLAHLASLVKLQRLDLTAGLVTDKGLEQLTPLTALGALSLGSTPITDAGLEVLGGMQSLTDLTLDGTQVTDAGLDHIASLPLTALRIGGTGVTDAGLTKLEAFDLRELSLYRLRGISDEGLRSVGSQAGLETLMIRGANVTEAGLAHLKDLKQLRTLNASLIVNDAAMVHLKDLTRLETLQLYSNPEITDAGAVHLRDLKNLRSLSMQFTQIGDETLKLIGDMPQLRFVDLRGTKTSPEAIEDFKTAHPDTRVFR